VVGEGVDKEIRAQRTTNAPDIDGNLDDDVWSAVPTDDRFTQSFPVDGGKPSVRTTIQIAFDNDNVYIAINAEDPEPSKVRARLSRRDSLPDSDWFEIVIDSRHDHDNGFRFSINAASVLADGQIHDDFRVNSNWDAVWRGRARVHKTGWSAEIAIPLSVLRFAKTPVPVWGFNVTRYVSRTKELMRWVHIPRTEQGTVSRAGHVVGLDGLEPRRAFELRPFVATRGERIYPTGGYLLSFGDEIDNDVGGQVGVDLKLGLTTDLTLDATVFPDFGQVEVDPVILNLSSFETFFPERRPFFLEGANLFHTDIRLFNSRRIGERTSSLSEGDTLTLTDGRDVEIVDTPLAVPIWTAVRVTGALTNRFIITALDAVTGKESIQVRDVADGSRSDIEPSPARNYAAARGKYTFGGSTYLGFLATAVTRLGQVDDANRDHDAYAATVDGRWVAADGQYRSWFQLASSVRVGGPEYIEREACTPSTPASCTRIERADGTVMQPGDSGYSGELGASKVGGGSLRGFARYRFTSPRFDVNDLGFENNWDVHDLITKASINRPSPFSVFQSASIKLTGLGQIGFDGLLKNVGLNLGAGGQWRNFWGSRVSVGARPSNTWTTRETSDGARFQRNGELVFNASGDTDSRRPFIVGGGMNGSASFSDDKWSFGAGVGTSWRIIPPLQLNLETGLGVSKNDLRFRDCTASDGRPCSLRSSSRTYRVSQLDSASLNITARATWALSPSLSLQGYLQLFSARGFRHDYGTISNQLGSRPFLARDEIVPLATDGDFDGDGTKDDDFEFSTLNANMVVRWELSPGTTLIVVYTRAQRSSVDLGQSVPQLGFSELSKGRTEEIVLAKLTLFYN